VQCALCTCVYLVSHYYAVVASFLEKGVRCVYDNAAVAKSATVLVLCCLPSQLPSVAGDIRNALRRETIVLSIVSATSLSRLQGLLGTSNILRPDITTASQSGGQQYDFSRDVCSALGMQEIVEVMCPLSFNKQSRPMQLHVLFLICCNYTVVQKKCTAVTEIEKFK